ncbi:MAG: hypothetical protein FWD73_13035 [Polyangiaceae bacterium]|nr:hypothetical protein [Polyangiaceae bacterium]
MSSRSSSVSALLGFALGTCVVLHTADSHAQTLAVNPAYPGNPPSLPRYDSNGNTVQKRPANLTPEGVSLQDCLDDQSILFPLVLSNFQAQASLQAWASVSGDCSDQTTRAGGTQVCWLLTAGIPLSTNPNVTIPVREIMAGAPPESPAAPDASQNVCGQVPLTTISVQFLYFDPGNVATPTASTTFTIQVDTIGPDAPTGLSHLPGNTRIKVSWDAIGEGGVVALTGVKVYCDPSRPLAATDAGTTLVCNDADADEDAGCTQVPNEGGTAAQDCYSPNFVNTDGSPILPDKDFDAKFLCGSISGSTGNAVYARSVGGQSLVNGTNYAVAVAATDAFDNVGPLSAVQCEVPEVTTDFWEDYKDAGGGAGGGYCTTGNVGSPIGSLSVLGITGMLALSTLRRIRRRARNIR